MVTLQYPIFGMLSVRDFSCIKSADLELKPITVLVGPQASGKSVLSKLVYFLIEIMSDQFLAIAEGLTYKQFTEKTKEKFLAHFPASAWGSADFQISYAAPPYFVRVLRVKSKATTPSSKIRIGFSKFFEELYVDALAATSAIANVADSAKTRNRLLGQWEVRREFTEQLKKGLGRRHIDSQLFIPAGRSFFTNAGKLVAILEAGNLIDPLISRFGRIFAATRDNTFYTFDPDRGVPFDDATTADLLGGKIRLERDKEFLEASDGRRIPFSSMSSGQQELVPLFSILNRWLSLRKDAGNQLVYVEEPEAHLFPAAQSRIVEAFAKVHNQTGGKARFIFTTHSPYVLAKLSNLLKAGSIVAEHPASGSQVSKVIRKQYWLDGKRVAAYAIRDGMLESILDREESAIAGDYIDEISGVMAREYAALLDIEMKHDS